MLACAGNQAGPGGNPAEAARAEAGRVLGLVQEWLAAEGLEESRLAVVTRGAAAAVPGEGVADLAGAAVQGLVRSAQTENPGRLVLADLPVPARGDAAGADSGDSDAVRVLGAGLGCGEPEVAVRGGTVLGRRLARPAGGLVPPPEGPWRLGPGEGGTLDGLALVPCPEAAGPLAAGQVRVAVRAAGVNFRDVLIALGVYPGAALLGGEIAGVVTGTGPGVAGLAAGDRVLGIAAGGFGPAAVTDARMVVPVPAGWSFAAAASVPVAFATAWYGLGDLAGARAGQRLLVHAATGGVGMAAVAVARHLGLEVFGTASPGKHPVLAAMGLDQAHVASSRDARFEEQFLAATGGAGMDIVLNALAGELTDASLRLLPRGGAFLEMGKTDPRDPAEVGRLHPGVAYLPFDVADAGPGRLGQILARAVALLAAGTLPMPPVAARDVRRAREAFRFMSQARHTGKLVLTIPPAPAAPRPPGTVLVTGGTGLLGGLAARHLAAGGRAAALVLASRSGPAAPGVPALAAAIARAGTAVRVAACDTASRAALAGLLAGEELTRVVHAAGTADDAVTGSLTAARVEAVMRPKADTAWHLHQLTRHMDLEQFTLYSSAAAALGSPGQGNYAAANAFLDALAAARRAQGLPAQSLAWGLWEGDSAVTSRLTAAGRDRITRSGMTALPPAQGLALLDAAAARDEALLVAARIDIPALRAAAASGTPLPPLWTALAGAPPRPPAAAGPGAPPSLAAQLAALPPADRTTAVQDLVRAHAAAVLGHPGPAAIDPARPFTDLGFDSLTAVELRNRLAEATGLSLPATLVFDYPSPAVLGGFLERELSGVPEVLAGPAMAAGGDLVVIVGMGCRYPGADGPQGLWELLAGGTDAVGPFPADRGWDLEALYDQDPGHAGTSYAAEGGFLAGAGEFDAGFFGISPREALAMDPQQRLLLEVSWEALEDAGMVPARLRGSRTGVFAGLMYHDYGSVLAGGQVPAGVEGYLGTGGSGAVVSGRVSYVLGLEGPAVTVDTACSSSLVALHLAAQSLRSGECDLALAGGVTVMATPGTFIDFSRQRGLAADGRCKSYAEAADGTGWSEEVGVLVVERLADARRLGHRVLAVVRGSAVNQDGASNGLTAPNGPSQQRVIRAALASAGLAPADVDVVEGHGTGTVLGDPIEAQALIAAYGRGRDPARPLWLGSVKSNLGHAQAAAGAAGIIKMITAMSHGTVPATLHVEVPTTKVDWGAGQVRLATASRPWPDTGRPRRAGVSSFGISGTNAHVILERPPADPAAGSAPAGTVPAVPVLLGGVTPWLVSARTAGGLAAQAGRLAGFLAARPGLDPGDVGWSLAVSRSVFEYRAVVTGAGREELAAGLGALAAGEPGAGLVTGAVPAGGAGRVGFVFSGQGAQRAGMGAGLHAASPVFAAVFDRACALLEAGLGVPVSEVVLGGGEDGRADQTLFAQPGLFAVQAGLVALLASCGVVPDAVAGHSVGEVTAAYAAGVLSLEDACALVAARARLMQALPGGGAMTAVEATEDEAAAALAGVAGVSVAAVNGPSSVVVSGDAAAVAGIAEGFRQRGRRVRPLRVSHAFHSARMDPVLAELGEAAAGLEHRAPRILWAQALAGGLAGTCEPGYWARQAREPVRYAGAVRALAAAGVRTFIEIGPDGTLSALGPAALDGGAEAGQDPADGGAVFIAVLRPGRPPAAAVLAALAAAHVHGAGVDWAAVLGGGERVELPTYAFQHERYWPRPRAAAGGDVRLAGLGAVGHPLLGAAVELAGGGLVLTGLVSARTVPWLADHAVGGTVLLPGTAFVELAAVAAYRAGCGQVAELTVEAPLALDGGRAVQLQVTVAADPGDGQRAVEVYARTAGAGQDVPWTRHARGLLAPAGEPAGAGAGEFAAWPPAGAVPVDAAGLYEGLAAAGYGYGPSFRGLRAAWRHDGDILAEAALPEAAAAEAGGYGLHPALLDAALHALGLPGTPGPPGGDTDGIRLPFAWTGVSLHAAGASVLRARLRTDSEGRLSLTAADGAGAPVISVRSLVLRPIAPGQLDSSGHGPLDALFTVEWVPVPAVAEPAPGRLTVVGGDGLGLAAELSAAGFQIRACQDLETLAAAIETGEPAPAIVMACVGAADGGRRTEQGGKSGHDGAKSGEHRDAADAARAATAHTLGLVQAWLAEPRLESARLVLVTRGAVAGPGEGVEDLAGAALWGLVRSAQSENPGRLVLADLSGTGRAAVLAAALGSGEPELAVRGETAYARRLARLTPGLVPPSGGLPWRLEVTQRGTLDGLALVACPQAAAPLAAGQVRVAVRAAGMNFRDVLIGLDMYPGPAVMGGEIAGVATEIGPEITGLAVGDRVFGLVHGAFGPVAVADARLLARIPAGWSFAAAASVPVAFTTAWYALANLAGARAGQRLLVHAATGGVGMAAVAVARHLGLEVFGTASPGKHPVLAAMGLDQAHVASSRDARFEEQFLAATGGAGMDIVLNALAGELTDASLRLLPRGGAFLEMGKTDPRDPAEVGRLHPGVAYLPFETGECAPELLGEFLAEMTGLLASGKLAMPPMRAWDVRRAVPAFRFMSQARHTGKIVLIIPQDPVVFGTAGTVLVTGGTGTLGGLVARHLAGAAELGACC